MRAFFDLPQMLARIIGARLSITTLKVQNGIDFADYRPEVFVQDEHSRMHRN